MKTILTTLLFVFMVSFSYSQNKLKKVKNNTYEMVETLESGTQVGFFKKTSDGKFVRHGEWKLLKDDNVITTVYYENDVMVWIEPENGKRYTKEQLEIERLKNKVNKLQEELASNY